MSILRAVVVSHDWPSRSTNSALTAANDSRSVFSSSCRKTHVNPRRQRDAKTYGSNSQSLQILHMLLVLQDLLSDHPCPSLLAHRS